MPFKVKQQCIATLTLDEGIVQKNVTILRVYNLYQNIDDSPKNYWVIDDDGDKYMVEENQLTQEDKD